MMETIKTMQSNSLTFQQSKSGFSILMAIGTIGVLLILITSLAATYIRESRLARFAYDDVIASVTAEWQFEYAMLKTRNHRDGFQDATFSWELDGNLLDLTTARSQGLRTEYSIVASSTGTIFTLSGGQHLIVPLFVDSGSLLDRSVVSRDPSLPDIRKTLWLGVTWLTWLSWTVVAMSGSESVAITGVWDISPDTIGKVRIRAIKCYRYDGEDISPISGMCDPALIHRDYNPLDGSYTATGEELQYSYDVSDTIARFISSDGTRIFWPPATPLQMQITDPYLMIYNWLSWVADITLSSSTPFALPMMTLTSTARKWESSQIFQFREDKSRYYDALKYGIYNTTP